MKKVRASRRRATDRALLVLSKQNHINWELRDLKITAGSRILCQHHADVIIVSGHVINKHLIKDYGQTNVLLPVVLNIDALIVLPDNNHVTPYIYLLYLTPYALLYTLCCTKPASLPYSALP